MYTRRQREVGSLISIRYSNVMLYVGLYFLAGTAKLPPVEDHVTNLKSRWDRMLACPQPYRLHFPVGRETQLSTVQIRCSGEDHSTRFHCTFFSTSPRQAAERARARWEEGQKVAMEKAAVKAVEDREKALEDARRVRLELQYDYNYKRPLCLSLDQDLLTYEMNDH